MAKRLSDGTIQLKDGRIIYGNNLVLAQDLCEIVPLCVPPPAWPFVSGGGGGGGGGTGTPGRNGVQGVQGPAGAFGGPQGAQGFQGSGGLGPQGPQGFQGLVGSGAQGNQGTQGNQGNQGNQGSGIQGNQGNQGNQGVFGTQGFQGALNPDIFAATRVVDAGGTGTDTTIAAAIAALPAEGGDIYIKQGTYAQAATLVLPNKNIRIRGSGNGTLITSPSALPLFSVAAAATSRYEFATFRVTGDNSIGNALINLDSAVDVSFEEVHTSAVRDIVVTSTTPEVSFSFCSFAMTAANNWSFWRGSSTGGLLTWDYVDVTVGATQSTTGIVGNPEWTVTASYVGGGGPLTSSLNLGRTTIQGFRADKLRFILGSNDNRIVNLNLIDGNVTINNARTAIANSVFLTPTLSGTEVTVSGTGGAGGQVAITFSGCVFDSAGVQSTNSQIDIANVQGVEIVGCSFSNNGTGAVTDANIHVGATGGSNKLTVVGCQFFGGNPVQALLEFSLGGTITGRYDDNLNFSSATIVSNESTVNGMKRFGVTAGATTDAPVTQFTHTNTRGLVGVGTVKNTGANSMNVIETAIDAFGTTSSTTTVVLAGNDLLIEEQVNINLARPPYRSYSVAVQSTVAGNPTTFNLQFGSQGAEA
jgi:hypothetical protein